MGALGESSASALPQLSTLLLLSGKTVPTLLVPSVPKRKVRGSGQEKLAAHKNRIFFEIVSWNRLLLLRLFFSMKKACSESKLNSDA